MLCKVEGSSEYQPISNRLSYDKIVEVKLSAKNAEGCEKALAEVEWKALSNLKKIVIDNCDFTGYTWDDSINFPQLEEIEFIHSDLDVATTNSLLDTATSRQLRIEAYAECTVYNSTSVDDEEEDDESISNEVKGLINRIQKINDSPNTTNDIFDLEDSDEESQFDLLSDNESDDGSESGDERSTDDDSRLDIILESRQGFRPRDSHIAQKSQSSQDSSQLLSPTGKSNIRRLKEHYKDDDNVSAVTLPEDLEEEEVIVRRNSSLNLLQDENSVDETLSRRSGQSEVTFRCKIGDKTYDKISEEKFDSLRADVRAAITSLYIHGHGSSITHINFAGLTNLEKLEIVDAKVLDVADFILDEYHDDTVYPNLNSLTMSHCAVSEDGIQRFVGRNTNNLALNDLTDENGQSLSRTQITDLENFVEEYRNALSAEDKDEYSQDLNEPSVQDSLNLSSISRQQSLNSLNTNRSTTDSGKPDRSSQSDSLSKDDHSLSSVDLSYNERIKRKKVSNRFDEESLSSDQQAIDKKIWLQRQNSSRLFSENSHSSLYRNSSMSRGGSPNNSSMFTPPISNRSHNVRHQHMEESGEFTPNLSQEYKRKMKDEASLYTPNSKQQRGLKKIEEAIHGGLNQQIGTEGAHRDNYRTVKRTNEKYVSLTYQTSNKNIPVMDVASDSVRVYKSWRKNVSETTVAIEDKAMIVLASLGIPPYPPHGVDVEGEPSSPLVQVINKILKDLQLKNKTDSDDDEEIHIQIRPNS